MAAPIPRSRLRSSLHLSALREQPITRRAGHQSLRARRDRSEALSNRVVNVGSVWSAGEHLFARRNRQFVCLTIAVLLNRKALADVLAAQFELSLPYTLRLGGGLKEMHASHAAGVVRTLLLTEIEQAECLRFGELLIAPCDSGSSRIRLTAVLGLIEPTRVQPATPAEVHSPIPGAAVLGLQVDDGVHMTQRSLPAALHCPGGRALTDGPGMDRPGTR